MTEDTSPSPERLWIWVEGWERFQGRRDRPNLAWFRVYSDLFSDDDFMELSSANRVLLLGIYSDTNRAGLGRVSGNIAALRSRHNVRRAALDPLIQAGFITLSTTKGAPTGHQIGVLEEKRESTTYSLREEKNARAAHAENGGARAQKKIKCPTHNAPLIRSAGIGGQADVWECPAPACRFSSNTRWVEGENPIATIRPQLGAPP